MISLDAKTAVVLFNLGGPDSLDAVEPFLFNLFSDPDIIKLPFGSLFQKPLARYISKRRSGKVRERYALIGGKSPILELTMKQADRLQHALESHGNFKVFIAMRYWNPLTEEAVARVRDEQFEQLVLLPLYPHYSIVTTGSSYHEWERVCRKYNISFPNVRNIYGFADWGPYVDALEEKVKEGLGMITDADPNSVHLLFSAHGVPLSIIANGDPYLTQILTTIDRVTQRFPGFHYHVSYQSRVGRKKWLEPETIHKVTELGKQGIRKILVIPISFVSDHYETLDELNNIVREYAENAGVEEFKVMPALNDSPLFINALSQLVLEEMRLWKIAPVQSH